MPTNLKTKKDENPWRTALNIYRRWKARDRREREAWARLYDVWKREQENGFTVRAER